MGGHGGLNILPQKRWNVYNYDNREKVKRDEEAAAREEQLKREQARKHDAEFRLERMRQNRGLPPAAQADAPVSSEQKSIHINLFEGLKIFPSLGDAEEEKDVETDSLKKKKAKKEEKVAKVVLPEDEKYRLGYGVAGKGVKRPWYLLRPSDDVEPENDGVPSVSRKHEESKKSVKKTLEELREERFNREKREKKRERALVLEKNRRDGTNASAKGFSRLDYLEILLDLLTEVFAETNEADRKKKIRRLNYSFRSICLRWASIQPHQHSSIRVLNLPELPHRIWHEIEWDAQSQPRYRSR